jgi:hypothetical protein
VEESLFDLGAVTGFAFRSWRRHSSTHPQPSPTHPTIAVIPNEVRDLLLFSGCFPSARFCVGASLQRALFPLRMTKPRRKNVARTQTRQPRPNNPTPFPPRSLLPALSFEGCDRTTSRSVGTLRHRHLCDEPLHVFSRVPHPQPSEGAGFDFPSPHPTIHSPPTPSPIHKPVIPSPTTVIPNEVWDLLFLAFVFVGRRFSHDKPPPPQKPLPTVIPTVVSRRLFPRVRFRANASAPAAEEPLCVFSRVPHPQSSEGADFDFPSPRSTIRSPPTPSPIHTTVIPPPTTVNPPPSTHHPPLSSRTQ